MYFDASDLDELDRLDYEREQCVKAGYYQEAEGYEQEAEAMRQRRQNWMQKARKKRATNW